MNELPDVSYHDENDSLDAILFRRRTQLKNHKYKLEQEQIAKDKKEDQYFDALATAGASIIDKFFPRPFSDYRGDIIRPINRSRNALYQMSATYKPPFGERLDLIFSLHGSAQQILDRSLKETDVMVIYYRPEYTLPSLTNPEITSDLEPIYKRADNKRFPLTITTLVDITLASLSLEKDNDDLLFRFRNDALYVYARACHMWHTKNIKIERNNNDVANHLGNLIYNRYYDGLDEETGRAYVMKYHIYVKGEPTNWWLHNKHDIKILTDAIKAGNPVTVYGKRGSFVKIIMPDASEVTLALEPLTDQYLMQRVDFNGTFLLAPPDTPSLAPLVAEHKSRLIAPLPKPHTPSQETIIDQGYYPSTSLKSIQHKINQIKYHFLNEELS